MNRIVSAVIVSLLLSTDGFSQNNNTGSITVYVDSLMTKIPDVAPANLYQTPNGSQKTAWESIVDDMMKGNVSAAHASAITIGYGIVNFADTTNGKTYFILRKTSDGANYWGTFIVNPAPNRSRLFIQIPHPVFDTKTGNQGIVVFKQTGARAFIVSGTHRCNSTQLSPCDGTTSVCSGSSQPFSSSDQAHTVDGSFQFTTSLFAKNQNEPIIVQLHGFGKGSGDPDVILGNGTNKKPASADYALIFKNSLAALDTSLTFKIAHIDTTWTELTGTTNTQGRFINGSSDPCGTKASSSSGRFLHVEQAYAKLRDTPDNWMKIANALSNGIPSDPTSVASNGDRHDLHCNLLVNYPNPFNPFTTIGFSLKEPGITAIKIYDMIGREVAVLVNEFRDAGQYHQIRFDASSLASGIYVARLTSGSNIQFKKMILVK